MGARIERFAEVSDRMSEAAMVARVPAATGRRRVDVVLAIPATQSAGVGAWYWNAVLLGLFSAGLLIDTDDEHAERGSMTFRDGKKATEIHLADLADAGPELPDHPKAEQVQDTGRAAPAWGDYVSLFPSAYSR